VKAPAAAAQLRRPGEKSAGHNAACAAPSAAAASLRMLPASLQVGTDTTGKAAVCASESVGFAGARGGQPHPRAMGQVKAKQQRRLPASLQGSSEQGIVNSSQQLLCRNQATADKAADDAAVPPDSALGGNSIGSMAKSTAEQVPQHARTPSIPSNHNAFSVLMSASRRQTTPSWTADKIASRTQTTAARNKATSRSTLPESHQPGGFSQ
jgi:hypothetical protein